MKVLTLYVDGGNHGKNPSDSVYWSVGRECLDGRIIKLTDRATTDACGTNNCAEYLALLDALQHAANIPGIGKVIVHSDSQLIVHQFNGKWGCYDANLRPLLADARRAAEFLTNGGVEVEVTWVRRAENVKRLGH